MLLRDGPNGLIAISQPSHAWLSGQIIRAWGNAEFGAVAPREDVCLAAEQHDIGWLEWERSPTLNLATGRPHSFRELSVAEHTAIWRGGTEMALTFGRYPALLVSLHGTGLYAGFNGTATDAVIVRDFLSRQLATQQRLLDGLGTDPYLGQFCGHATIERNRGLVRAADRMSIALCTGMQDPTVRSDNPHRAVVRQVPTASGQTDIQLSAIAGDLEKIAVAPWPFADAAVRVACEGIVLASRLFGDQAAMRVALRDADRVVLSVVLTPT